MASLLVAAILYAPSLQGPFLFDDLGLPFNLTLAEAPLSVWMIGARPLLMFTYWFNHQLTSSGTLGYHVVNICIHAANATLVWIILGRLLTLAGWGISRARAAAVIGAAIFLVHPLATESVSYIAGRSESLAALFVLSAYALFLHRRESIVRWRDAALILLLFACGLAVKENAIALAGILVLTDWIFPRTTARRLYILMLPGALLASAYVLRTLSNAPTAGLRFQDFTWYQYAFTQARAVFTYVRLALLPYGQSVDHDFPISRTVLDHGAWLGLLALAALIAAGVRYHRRYPLACFGFLMFLVWLAPTSSVIPIADPLVERRMYLPLLGLILIGCDAVSRLRLPKPVPAGVTVAPLVVLALLTWHRNTLWGSAEDLLQDAALQSVHNPRPVANLTENLIAANRCQEALPWIVRAGHLLPQNYVIEASWSRALECLGKREEALAHLNTAAALHPAWKLYELMGLLYGEMNRLEESGAALRKAVAMEPRAGSPHRSLALWYEATHDLTAAAAEYRAALACDPNDTQAQIGLTRVQAIANAPSSRDSADRAP